MAHSIVLSNDGLSGFLLNDGSSFVLLNQAETGVQLEGDGFDTQSGAWSRAQYGVGAGFHKSATREETTTIDVYGCKTHKGIKDKMSYPNNQYSRDNIKNIKIILCRWYFKDI